MAASAQAIAYAKLAAQVYNDLPQVGAVNGAARARMYGNVLAFRGTDDAATWLADLEIETEFVAGLGVLHKGFWRALAGVLPDLRKLPTPEVIVGHSEGAALATIYAGVLCMQGEHSVQVYGFEPPRLCGNGVLRQVLDDDGIQRFYTSNGSDPVPLVPPELSLPGELALIGAPRGPIPLIEDHYIDNVIRSLES